MTKLSLKQLINVFGRKEVSEILSRKLSEGFEHYIWLRDTYERKKFYLNSRINDEKTPEQKTYLELKSQLLDIELLPLLESSSKKLNRFAYQFMFASNKLSPRNNKFIDEARLDQFRQIPIENLFEGKLRGTTRLTGLCPFHEEKTPSFVIYTQTNSFYCFGCRVTGIGAIDFLIKKDNLTFLGAVRRLL